MATQRGGAPTTDVSRSTAARPSNNTSNFRRPDGTTGKRSDIGGGFTRSKNVAWADDKNTTVGQRQVQDEEQLTFYRESTPPPPDDDDGHGNLRNGPLPSNDYGYDHVAPPAPIPQPAVCCGIRKRLFWILVCLVAFVVVAAAVGVGVGLGVGTVKPTETSDQKSSTAASGPSPPMSSTTTPSTSAQPTQTLLELCPAANSTKFEIPQLNKTFLLICGVDYTGQGEAIDLGVVRTASMQDCILRCAGQPNCTGCGWGVIPEDAGGEHQCWLRGDLQKSRTVRSGWDFAILLQ
ncbi:hypothetical protein E4U41_007709 [Claviceps citrina]|nr:hypothetical protein E4U41_007709 [Claviceps citrina]